VKFQHTDRFLSGKIRTYQPPLVWTIPTPRVLSPALVFRTLFLALPQQRSAALHPHPYTRVLDPSGLRIEVLERRLSKTIDLMEARY
jgi:hypothetical protein